MIARRPIVVYWRLGGMLYAMMEVRPNEMQRMMKKCPDLLGIPCMYALVGDDVEWFPNCKEGEPVLGFDDP